MCRVLTLLMAVYAAAGSFNITTAAAGNTVVVSGLTDGDGGGSFTPKLIFTFWNGRTASTDGIGRASQNRGFGVAVDGSGEWAVGSQSSDAAGSAVTSSSHIPNGCVMSCADTAIDGVAHVQSYDAGGFTLVIDDAFPTDLRVGFIAFGGDVTANAGILTPTGTAPVTQAVAHGLSSTPAAILFGSAGIANSAAASAVDSDFMLGGMSGTANEGVNYGASNDGANTMATVGYSLSTEVIATPSTAVATLANRAECSSIDGTNFTINWLERANAGRVFWVAVGGTGVQATIGNLLTQTDTTTEIVETINFRPKGILFASVARAASTADTPTAHDHVSIGAAASPSQRCAVAALDEDAVGTSEVTLASEFDEVYINISTASAVQGLMDLKSVENDGFTCIMDDADPSQSFVWYLAVGSAVTAGRTTKNTRAWPLGTEIGMDWRMECAP